MNTGNIPLMMLYGSMTDMLPRSATKSLEKVTTRDANEVSTSRFSVTNYVYSVLSYAF